MPASFFPHVAVPTGRSLGPSNEGKSSSRTVTSSGVSVQAPVWQLHGRPPSCARYCCPLDNCGLSHRRIQFTRAVHFVFSQERYSSLRESIVVQNAKY